MNKKIVLTLLLSLFLFNGGLFAMSDNSAKVLKGKEGVFAVMNTSKGEIVLELFYEKTPLTVTNFVGLAEGTLDVCKGKKFYDGLTFHRVIKDFMIQGGDPEGTGRGGPGYRFADEFDPSLKFTGPGDLAMANAGPGTNGSQFFITHVKTEWLNGKHTIFGHVVDENSQKVVNKIQQGDKIISVEIVRLGDKAQKFTATQADFNRLSKEAVERSEKLKKEQFNAFVDGCKEDSNGIYYKVLKEGKGEKIGKGKKAYVEYKGYLQDGSLFDASSKFYPGAHEGFEFTVGGGEMIPGFDIMVADMKVGEVRKMVIPPQLAYGSRGVPQAGIAGGVYIAFDVEVVSAR